MVAARLSDVAPDGKATRVTYGLLNLTHRDGHAVPEPLEPGRRYRVRVSMNHVAQSFPKGHRIRLSLSTSYWALAWPPPQPVRLSLFDENSTLLLPLRAPRQEDGGVRFEPAEGTPPPAVEQRQPAHHNWLVHRDLAGDESVLEVIKDEGTVYFPDLDLEVGDATWNEYTYHDDDFGSPRGETRTRRSFRRGEWTVRTTTRTVLTADATHFHIRAELDAYEGEARIYSESWSRTLPRDLV
jgi:hypothetical protein